LRPANIKQNPDGRIVTGMEQLAAMEILHGATVDLLSPFRPARFA